MEAEAETRQLKLSAKRTNERLKLAAAFLNALGIGIIGAAFIIPGVANLTEVRWSWLPAGLLLHVFAHVAVSLIRSED